MTCRLARIHKLPDIIVLSITKIASKLPHVDWLFNNLFRVTRTKSKLRTGPGRDWCTPLAEGELFGKYFNVTTSSWLVAGLCHPCTGLYRTCSIKHAYVSCALCCSYIIHLTIFVLVAPLASMHSCDCFSASAVILTEMGKSPDTWL